MAEKDSIEHVDALENEILEYEAFLHKKGILKEFDKWLDSEEKEEDMHEYEKFVTEEGENIDLNEMKVEEE